jgi:hypothetical protein
MHDPDMVIQPDLPPDPDAVMGLLKKAASGVLAIFPCSHMTHTLRASKWLRPCWTDFFEPTPSL